MKLQHVCIILATVTTSTSYRYSHIMRSNDDEGHGVLFDPWTQKCCHGVAYPRTRASYSLCCGNKTYDITEEICCQGTPLPLTFKTRTACCGRKTYDVKASLCCEGRVGSLLPGTPAEDLPYFECIGGKAIDSRESRQSPSLEEESIYFGRYEYYNKFTDYPRRYPPFPRPTGVNNTCSGVIYNTTTEACCGNVIKESTVPYSECCGPHLILYDTKKEVCCKSPNATWKVSPKPPDNANYPSYAMPPGCCGGIAYDGQTDLCCDEVLHKIPSGEDGYYECCGPKMINGLTHACCSGQTVIESVDGTERCCGSGTYSSQKQLCCYHHGVEKVFDKPENYPSDCCLGQVFNKKTHLCCLTLKPKDGNFHILVEKKNNTSECCGGSTYDTTKEICCGGSATSSVDGQIRLQCCGEVVYNTKTHTCCDQKVLDIKEKSKTSCCSVSINDDYNGHH